MRKLFHDWLFFLGLVGLLAMLTSCGGGSGSTSNGNGSASPSTSTGTTAPTSSTGNTTSTVSFTGSGGLSSSYTLNAGESSQIVTTSKNKKLTIIATGNGTSISIIVLPYTGPGSYTLSNKYFSDNSQSKTIDVQTGQKVWGGFIRLSPSWTCSLNIASDTAVTVTLEGQTYTNFHRVTGSFSCSMVLSALNTDPPLNLSNGQIDVLAQTTTG